VLLEGKRVREDVWNPDGDVLDSHTSLSYHGTTASANRTGTGVDDHTALRGEIETYIIELLAVDQERDADELRAELIATGPDMGYDSVLLVELMTRVGERYGVRFKATYATARDMRSVRSFAERVCDELVASAHLTAQPPASSPVPTGSD
jgi:acyl carrier protein